VHLPCRWMNTGVLVVPRFDPKQSHYAAMGGATLPLNWPITFPGGL
jgi:hypothetical protein